MATRTSVRKNSSVPSIAKAVSATKALRNRSHTKPDRDRQEHTSRILKEIADLIKERSHGNSIHSVTLQELDLIADYVPPAAGRWRLESIPDTIYLDDAGTCICNVLPSLDWWRQVAACLAQVGQDDDLNPSATLKPCRQKLLSLLDDTLRAYVSAESQGPSYEYSDGDATLELLRRYRLYTRYIVELAQRTWPLANLDPLYQLV
ncbi:MAG TPA: hypothetical protein VMI06_03900 [Terriglobia bacterium]|nr:hypothetical protein [Terriglobia bacterium]